MNKINTKEKKGNKKAQKRVVLGKGLGALLTEALPMDAALQSGSADEGRVFEIELTRINTGVYQPRKHFDEDRLKELKDSIREKGIIAPLIVVRTKDTKGSGDAFGFSEPFFDLIAGERRYRAARELGFKTVPAIIKDLTGSSALEIALVENIQRHDLNALEEAGCYLRLIEEFGLTHDELSKKVGKDRATITNMLRLLALPGEIKKELISGRITPSHARSMIGLSKEEVSRLLSRITSEKLTVRDIENAAKISRLKSRNRSSAQLKSKSLTKKSDVSTSSQIKCYEEELFEEFQAPVRINYHGRGSEIKGKIEINFYSSRDMERIISRLKGE